MVFLLLIGKKQMRGSYTICFPIKSETFCNHSKLYYFKIELWHHFEGQSGNTQSQLRIATIRIRTPAAHGREHIIPMFRDLEHHSK